MTVPAAAMLTLAGAAWAAPRAATHAASTTVKYVDMVNVSGGNPFAYKPQTITIKAGMKIVWRNKSMAPHTVTGIGTTFAGVKSSISPGQQTSYVFRHAGSFRYYCTYHPYMKAKVMREARRWTCAG